MSVRWPSAFAWAPEVLACCFERHLALTLPWAFCRSLGLASAAFLAWPYRSQVSGVSQAQFICGAFPVASTCSFFKVACRSVFCLFSSRLFLWRASRALRALAASFFCSLAAMAAAANPLNPPDPKCYTLNPKPSTHTPSRSMEPVGIHHGPPTPQPTCPGYKGVYKV